MKRLALSTIVFTAVTGGAAGIYAQSHIVLEPPATPPTTRPKRLPVAPPVQATPSGWTFEDEEREELAWTARKSRNYLIGMSAATALGVVLVVPAELNQCVSLDVAENAGVRRCTPGGWAMVGIGYSALLVGGVGMLASGLALAISKGQLRRYDKLAAQRKSRAFRWDPVSSRFVF
jgi:hypothetical protein